MTAKEIKLYTRVQLTDGSEASIVEILDKGKVFLADVDRNGDTDTVEIKHTDIQNIIVAKEEKRGKAIVTVYRPLLTEEEQQRREEEVKKALIEFYKETHKEAHNEQNSIKTRISESIN